MTLDTPLFNLIFSLAHKNAFLDAIGILLAVYLPYLLVIGFLYLVWREKSARKRVFFFAQAALATILSRGIITEIIRFVWNRARPFEVLELSPLIAHNGGGAFPSGHMAFYMAFAVALWYMNKRWGWWYIALTALVGLSRVFVGVHWPIDILGGIVVGAVSAMLVVRLLRQYGMQFVAANHAGINLHEGEGRQ